MSERRALPWRRWLHAAHRDVGYLAVGLTLVYAVSGIAVNHNSTWDPSFEQFSCTITVAPALLAGDDQAIAQRVLAELAIDQTPRDVFRASDTRLDITLEDSTVHVNPQVGTIAEEGQRARRGAALDQLAAPQPRQGGVDVVRRPVRGRPCVPRDFGPVHVEGPPGRALLAQLLRRRGPGDPDHLSGRVRRPMTDRLFRSARPRSA